MLAAYLVVTNLLLLSVFLAVWPGIELVQLPSEIRFLLIATLSAGMGSTVFASLSFLDLSLKHRLFESWSLWYLIYPFTGMTTGLFVYLTIRIGILKWNSQIDVLNPYIIAALSALAGFWTRHMLRKLKEHAERRKKRYMKRF
ncbi:MAG: hypothetical protein ACE5JB_13435 [bacterium]